MIREVECQPELESLRLRDWEDMMTERNTITVGELEPAAL